MLRMIKDVQSDDTVVGFYQSTSMGAFFAQSLVELQTVHQDRLRHGGLVIVHGAFTLMDLARAHKSRQTQTKLHAQTRHSALSV